MAVTTPMGMFFSSSRGPCSPNAFMVHHVGPMCMVPKSLPHSLTCLCRSSATAAPLKHISTLASIVQMP
jgi:hypothetical protein